MLYRIKRDYFDIENDAGEISPNKNSSYYPGYMYFRNFIFSDGPGLSGMVDFWVVSHPSFTKHIYVGNKVDRGGISYKKNELRGTRYRFEDDRLEVYTQAMADQDAAEELEKKYAGKIRGIVKTIIIPAPGDPKQKLDPENITVRVHFSFVYMGRLWSVHRSIETVQDDPRAADSPWRYKVNDMDDLYRKYTVSDYETGRSVTGNNRNPNNARREAERTLSEAGPERLKAAVAKGKIVNPLPALAQAIIKEMPTRAKKPSENIPREAAPEAQEAAPQVPEAQEAAPGTQEARERETPGISEIEKEMRKRADMVVTRKRKKEIRERFREKNYPGYRETAPVPKTPGEFIKKWHKTPGTPDIPDYDPETDSAPEIPDYDPEKEQLSGERLYYIRFTDESGNKRIFRNLDPEQIKKIAMEKRPQDLRIYEERGKA